jgi:hypothetical protein
VDKYKECHAKVWPEVLKQIKDCNIEDCRFLRTLVLKDDAIVSYGLFLRLETFRGFDM